MITHKSKLSDGLRRAFLSSPFFYDVNYRNETNFFDVNAPRNKIDEAVLDLLDQENYINDKPYIEYWFQKQTTGQRLQPHVDFNHGIRVQMNVNRVFPPEQIMSPITIACYLEIIDLIGGEFCISEKSWLELEEREEEIMKYGYEMYSPTQGDILFFEGSRYYHWINAVQSGSRKSMLINFWNNID